MVKTEIEKLREERKEIDEKIREKMKEKRKNHINSTKKSNIRMRVSHKFNKEIFDIRERREKLDACEISCPKTTDLIVKHKGWKKIKEDVINFVVPKGNKGQMTIFLVFLIVVALLTAIFLFGIGLTLIKIDQALDKNIVLGQVNLQTVYNDTFGVYVDTFLNNADFYGLAVIFGMMLGLFISAYIVRNRFPKFGIILDIFILLTAYITSVYISSTYQTLINALSSAGETFLEVYTPKTSFFILNLPIFSTIIGVVLMVLFHAAIPRKEDENVYQSGGYLQGV